MTTPVKVFALSTVAAVALGAAMPASAADGGLPLPYSGDASLVSSDPEACASVPTVLAEMVEARDRVGGHIFAMSQGLQQAFADAWRTRVDEEKVPVALTLAHIFSDPISGTEEVTLVEFGDGGCPISHTWLDHQAWRTIAVSLTSIEA